MNIKQGFSLIEIMQTVILLGIIAGVSISFLSKINVDERLYTATVRQLTLAVQEAERQICSDPTPYCAANINKFWSGHMGNDVDDDAQCARAYGPGTTYEVNTNYCIKIVGADDACPPGMTKRNDTTCFGIPQCEVRNNNADGTVNILYTDAVPYHDAACPTDSGLNIDQMRPGNAGVYEICFRLHSLINHKTQTSEAANDLALTCIAAVDACILVDDDGDECSQNGNIQHANLILPNGVRIYNLSNQNIYTDDPDAPSEFIYIKYDRIPDVKNIKKPTTAAAANANPANFNMIPITLNRLLNP